MKYLIILGLVYLLFSISLNIKENLKENKKVIWLNVIGLVIVLIYLINQVLEILKY